jgi:putative MATE family efflux protein
VPALRPTLVDPSSLAAARCACHAVAAPMDAATRTRVGETWSLAWPVIIAFSLESVVGLADALMVGRLGAGAVAAVGVGVHILSAVNVGMVAVGVGSLAVVARHVGAGERGLAEGALRQAIVTAFCLAGLGALPVVAWAPAIVRGFGVASDIADTTAHFVRLVMLAVPSDAVVFVIASSLRAAGDTRTPLAIGVLVGTANVVIAWALIFGRFGLPALGVSGAALGTAAAFALGAVAGLVLLARGGLALQVRWTRFRLEPAFIRRILRVGTPAALEHLLMQSGFLAYMMFAAHYGTGAVAAYFIGVRVLALSFLPGLGFGAAAGTLVGQGLGARRPAEAERSGWVATGLAVGLMSAGGVVLLVAARPVARLFVSDPAVIEAAVPFIRVLAAAQPLMAIDFTVSGALRGAGDTRFPLAVAALAFYGGRLGASWVITRWLDVDIVWLWSTIIGDYLLRAVLKSHRFHSGRWKRVRV